MRLHHLLNQVKIKVWDKLSNSIAKEGVYNEKLISFLVIVLLAALVVLLGVVMAAFNSSSLTINSPDGVSGSISVQVSATWNGYQWKYQSSHNIYVSADDNTDVQVDCGRYLSPVYTYGEYRNYNNTTIVYEGNTCQRSDTTSWCYESVVAYLYL